MKILITGSNGFVGGGVGRFAARVGHEVLGIARASQAVAGWPGAYAQADALNSDLSGVMRDFAPDVVLHAAGTASVGASYQTPLDDLRAAVLTWANTLDAARRSGLRPLIFFPSSAAVYGNLAELPAREESPTLPISPYGFHKAACELLAREYAACFEMPIVVCRLFSLFGAAQRRLLVWEIYQQLADPGVVAWLQGTGAETRDYLHVADMASAFLRIAEGRKQEPDGELFSIVNVASGEETSVRELAERMRDMVAPGKEIRCRGVERLGDPRRWRADVSRLRSLAPSWQPQSLSQRLRECVTEWQNQSAE